MLPYNGFVIRAHSNLCKQAETEIGLWENEMSV